MKIFLVYIHFFISHVPPVHSFFKNKSVLKNLIHSEANDFLSDYLLFLLIALYIF